MKICEPHLIYTKIMAKKHLDKARKKRDNEFYTRYQDIQFQVESFKDNFAGKTVYCNCDSLHSNFYKYFYDNFSDLKLKRLIVTGLNPKTGEGQKIEYDGVFLRISPHPWDYADKQNLELLNQENLIVCTNPPFSKIRQYLPTVFDSKAQFLIMAPILIFKYKALIPYILADNVFWTTKRQGFWFHRDNGELQRIGSAVFITNLGQRPKHELALVDRNPATYKRFDKFPEWIEIGSIFKIPKSFEGGMGVPINYMFHHDPAAFRLVDIISSGKTFVEGEEKFARVIIKNREFC